MEKKKISGGRMKIRKKKISGGEAKGGRGMGEVGAGENFQCFALIQLAKNFNEN